MRGNRIEAEYVEQRRRIQDFLHFRRILLFNCNEVEVEELTRDNSKNRVASPRCSAASA